MYLFFFIGTRHYFNYKNLIIYTFYILIRNDKICVKLDLFTKFSDLIQILILVYILNLPAKKVYGTRERIKINRKSQTHYIILVCAFSYRYIDLSKF